MKLRMLLTFFIFMVSNGVLYAQSNPYQSECAKFESSTTFNCASYSNCRLLGGSSSNCSLSADKGRDKLATPIGSIGSSLEQQNRSQANSDQAERFRQQELQRQREAQRQWEQQYVPQQYQQQYQQQKR